MGRLPERILLQFLTRSEQLIVVQFLHIDHVNLLLGEPFDSLAVLPQPVLYFAIFRHCIHTQTMLLSLTPVALITPPISPSIYPKAMFLIILIHACILSAIIPGVYP